MVLNDGGANNSHKRKMKEIAAAAEPTPTPAATNQTNLFNLRGQPHVAPPDAPSIFSQKSLSLVQRIPNNAAHFKPFSYTAFLTAPDPEDYGRRTLPLIDLWNPGQQIDQIITSHNENLRYTLIGMVERLAEERAAKKLREGDVELNTKLTRNIELEQMAEHYKKEAYRLEERAEHYKKEASKLLLKVMSLEQSTEALKTNLEKANAAQRNYAEEESESSFVNADRVGPVRLDCKACEKQVATVMMWPCRHVCVCAACDDVTKACPVCRLPKTTSVEVCLPHN